MNNQLSAILQEFTAQRKYREQLRKEYLRRFETIRHHFHTPIAHEHIHHHAVVECQHGHLHKEHLREDQHQHRHPDFLIINYQHRSNVISHANEFSLVQPTGKSLLENERQQVPISQESTLSQEQLALQGQNQELKQTLQALTVETVQEIEQFKQAVENAKNKYLKEIQKLAESSQKSKDQAEAKMLMLKEQTESALQKNREIQQINANISKELEGIDSQTNKYIEEIKKEYDEKIASFQAVFNASNEKIEAMEKDFNQDEFVQNTLKNEELLKSFEQNASKAQETSKLLEDYHQLNQGKKEVLTQLRSNIEMKEKEIAKMGELQQKIKTIMERLNADKKNILNENAKMAKQLGQIKELLMATVNQGK